MKFIKVHNDHGTHLVNPRTVSCIFSSGSGCKICFDGDEYLLVDESIEEISALIEKAVGIVE